MAKYRHKRTGFKPSGAGRNERTVGAGRRSQKNPEIERTPSEWQNTGVFTGVSNPVKGVDPVVALMVRDKRREAAKAMRAWRKSLPKGVKI